MYTSAGATAGRHARSRAAEAGHTMYACVCHSQRAARRRRLPAVAAAATNASGEDDEDAMPPEEPTIIGRADDGEEEALLEVRTAMKRYDEKGDDGPQWRDLGKGVLRLMKHRTTQKARLVVRNDVGRVALNVALVPRMAFVQQKSNGIMFLGPAPEEGQNEGEGKQSDGRGAGGGEPLGAAPLAQGAHALLVDDRLGAVLLQAHGALALADAALAAQHLAGEEGGRLPDAVVGAQRLDDRLDLQPSLLFQGWPPRAYRAG